MGILDRIKRVFVPYPGGEISEDMRQKSKEIRSLQAQVNYLEKQVSLAQRLKDLQEVITEEGGGDDPIEKAFMQTVLGAFMSPNSPTGLLGKNDGNLKEVAVQNPSRNNEIAELIKKNVPAQYLGQLKNLSDADILDIRQRIEGNYGNKQDVKAFHPG